MITAGKVIGLIIIIERPEHLSRPLKEERMIKITLVCVFTYCLWKLIVYPYEKRIKEINKELEKLEKSHDQN